MESRLVDVTESIYGKLEQGNLNLFYQGERIGQVISTDEGTSYVLSNGFVQDHDRIYRSEETFSEGEVQQYVDECDQGWC